MIKNILTSGRYLESFGGHSTPIYFNTYNGALGLGDVRYNTASHMLEAYDGIGGWHSIESGPATITLSLEAESLLDWVREERNKQLEIEILAKSKPAVAIAIDNLNKTKAQLEATVILSKEHAA